MWALKIDCGVLLEIFYGQNLKCLDSCRKNGQYKISPCYIYKVWMFANRKYIFTINFDKFEISRIYFRTRRSSWSSPARSKRPWRLPAPSEAAVVFFLNTRMCFHVNAPSRRHMCLCIHTDSRPTKRYPPPSLAKAPPPVRKHREGCFSLSHVTFGPLSFSFFVVARTPRRC